MSAFPSLSINPVYPISESREDSTIKSDQEAGYQITRQRYSRVRKKWNLTYQYLVDADYTALTTFIDVTVKGGADMFTWTHPITSVSYNVRFENPPVIKAVSRFNGTTIYSADISLTEV